MDQVLYLPDLWESSSGTDDRLDFVDLFVQWREWTYRWNQQSKAKLDEILALLKLRPQPLW